MYLLPYLFIKRLSSVFALWSGASSGATAIVIVQSGIFADASRQLIRVLAQLELDFNSVERIVEYLDVVILVVLACGAPPHNPTDTRSSSHNREQPATCLLAF